MCVCVVGRGVWKRGTRSLPWPTAPYWWTTTPGIHTYHCWTGESETDSGRESACVCVVGRGGMEEGYQITAMANRTILVDNTWNNTHISCVGQVSQTEIDSGRESAFVCVSLCGGGREG